MRRRVVTLHLWLGLTVGLLWALQGLSGAMLVFHRDFIRASEAPAALGPMPSLDLIRQRVEATVGTPVSRIGAFDTGSDFIVVDFTDAGGKPRTALVEAASGEVRGTYETDPVLPAKGAFWRWVYHYHESLAGGARTQALVAISGLLLYVAIGAGLWLGWPKRGTWRGAFAFSRWKSRDQRLYGWHKAAGLMTGFLLLVTIPCGIYLIYAAEFRGVLARIIPHETPYRLTPTPAPGPVRIGPQAAFAVARSRFPHARFVSVSMPSRAAPAYVVRVRQNGELRRWAGLSSVAVDAATGETLHVYDAVSAPLSNRILDAAYPVHSGEAAGEPGRLIIMLAGLSLPLLYITGVWKWMRSRRRRSKKQKPANRAAVAAA